MYETAVIKHFSKVPVFSLADVAQIISNRGYAKQFVSRMIKKGLMRRVKKGLYSMHDDPFLVSTFLLRPSYISSFSALSFHHKIAQIPNEVFCFTSKEPRRYFFITKINFHHTKFFFGFEKEHYAGFEIPVATPEKAIIDSIGVVPLHIIEDAFSEVDAERMQSYLFRIGKSSVVKRIGYLLEKNGHDVYSRVKKFVDRGYIQLDPVTKNGKKKERRWRLLV